MVVVVMVVVAVVVVGMITFIIVMGDASTRTLPPHDAMVSDVAQLFLGTR
jgi:hypothetical protein